MNGCNVLNWMCSFVFQKLISEGWSMIVVKVKWWHLKHWLPWVGVRQKRSDCVEACQVIGFNLKSFYFSDWTLHSFILEEILPKPYEKSKFIMSFDLVFLFIYFLSGCVMVKPM